MESKRKPWILAAELQFCVERDLFLVWGVFFLSILFPAVFPAPGTVSAANRVGALEPTCGCQIEQKEIKDNQLN